MGNHVQAKNQKATQRFPDIEQWTVSRADHQKIDAFIARICENGRVSIEELKS